MDPAVIKGDARFARPRAVKICCMRVEVNLWLNSLDYNVNILPHTYWLVSTHSSGGICASFGYLLYVVFSLLRYHMVFFGWGGGWLSYSWDFLCLRKLIILFFYISLSKTDGSILGFLFWLINTGSLLEILSWIKVHIPYIINCDIWIRTCRLDNNWKCFS